MQPELSRESHSAQYIWFDQPGLGRNRFALFRKKIQIAGVPQTALLNIFADTVYQLFINGEFVEFGPVRFDPRFPLFDTHDIKNRLKPGTNVIAVHVNYFGMKTYKSIPRQAGMIAWGNILSDQNEKISLHTSQDSWKVKPDSANMERYCQKLSFALNSQMIFEQHYSVGDWTTVEYDDRDWNNAIELDQQSAHGQLLPRSIPFMLNQEISVQDIFKVLPLASPEDRVSFTVPIPHRFEDNSADYSDKIIFSSWVYSPIKQALPVATFWSEKWLNGEKITGQVDSSLKRLRIREIWLLNAGWNYLFGHVTAYYDCLHQYFALPKNSGVIFSAEKRQKSSYSFRHLKVLTLNEFNQFLKDKSFPYLPDDDLQQVGGWIKVKRTDTAYNPCLEEAWDDYEDEKVKFETLADLIGYEFKQDQYTYGFSILFDLGQTRLLFPQIKMSGVADAKVDLVYSERLAPDESHFLSVFNFPLGDRIFCHEDELNWRPIQPRGMRYLKLTIRNPQKDVKISSLQLRAADYPVEVKGYFNSSDPLLNEIWAMGQRTVITNMEDVYVDTVVRERGMYIRDTIIQYCVNLATFGDQKLMQRCLQLYGQSADETGKFRAVYPNTGFYTIADFSLELLEGYWIYYQHSGDVNRIQEDWDAILINLEWFNQLSDEREDGLLDAEWHKRPGINGIKRGFYGDRFTPEFHFDVTGIHCYFSTTYLIALQAAAKLAQVIGETEDYRRLLQRIKRLSAAITTKFWDGQREVFVDNLNKTTSSVQANLAVARAGIASPQQMEGVKQYLSRVLRNNFINGFNPDDGTLVGTSYAFYAFDALYKMGLTNIAENLMKTCWGWTRVQGLTTTIEHFDIKTPRVSFCHGWSASPTYYLSKNVLGVHFPDAPNLNQVDLIVQTDCIDAVEGAFPHPRGLIEVKWHTENGKRVFDFIKVPKGVTYRVR
ncbi:MAG: hypothetical protein WAN66_18955 [Limnoraphis robusta]|uniref:alpha-L-rhamnosidase-related protein n=1 Tax=Limnoraphis robusta TaxID=1118279 RepID=UPI002B1F19E0|nr:hypothetical protein [Limnoraphis robusta]MEA5497831.1 hypothetical protein [Limnoraphis robusta BA-68 BA1]